MPNTGHPTVESPCRAFAVNNVAIYWKKIFPILKKNLLLHLKHLRWKSHSLELMWNGDGFTDLWEVDDGFEQSEESAVIQDSQRD